MTRLVLFPINLLISLCIVWLSQFFLPQKPIHSLKSDYLCLSEEDNFYAQGLGQIKLNPIDSHNLKPNDNKLKTVHSNQTKREITEIATLRYCARSGQYTAQLINHYTLNPTPILTSQSQARTIISDANTNTLTILEQLDHWQLNKPNPNLNPKHSDNNHHKNHAEGSSTAKRTSLQITSDEFYYFPETQQLQFKYPLTLMSNNTQLQASSGRYDVLKQLGEFHQVRNLWLTEQLQP